MTTPANALAALRDGDRQDPKPLRLKLDSGLSIEAPSARRLAEVFALPLLRADADVFRSGSAILTRPKGSSAEPTALALADIAATIRAALEALPELTTSESGRPYRDARLFVSEGSPASVAAYLDAVVRSVRSSATLWRPAARKVERAPAKSAAERKAAQRERDKAVEEHTARWWLEAYLAAEDTLPGDRVDAVELLTSAVDAIDELVEAHKEHAAYPALLAAYKKDPSKFRSAPRKPDDWAEIVEDEGCPETVAVPRKSIFYRIADEVLGTRRRAAAGYVYVIPEPAPATTEEDPVNLETVREETAAYVAAAEAGERLLRVREQLAAGQYAAALREQSDRLAATGTDGVVLDLATARAARN